GDKVIIIAYCYMTPEEAESYEPNIVFVDENNKQTG
ncbi:MAG: aspartate 1-decarboxylase, partial [Clostridia bacterium]|nr:aspartate 1-decarboxylase [Clostridia bacterium]